MTGTLHIVLAMKPLEGNFVQNALKHGVAGINIDGCRVGTDGGTERASNPMHKGRANMADFTRGYFGVSAIAKGRWPANVILDGSDEIVGKFPVTTQNGYRKNPSTNKTTWFGAKDDSHIEGERGFDDSGSAARFFKQVKA
jgi:site-specific DNA-methyltransferase (adenine-specific)